MNDEKIISLYFERNEEAVLASDEKYGKYCFAVANNILESEEDSKECVNDTWLRAWNSIPPAKPSVLKLFFAKITRNLAFDKYEKSHTKKRESFASLLSELEECIPSVTDTESEYSSKQIAKNHMMSENSVSAVLSRTRKKLRAYLYEKGFTV